MAPVLAPQVALTDGLNGERLGSSEQKSIDSAQIDAHRDLVADYQAGAGVRSDAPWAAQADKEAGVNAQCCMSKQMATSRIHEEILDGLGISARDEGFLDIALCCSSVARVVDGHAPHCAGQASTAWIVAHGLILAKRQEVPSRGT